MANTPTDVAQLSLDATGWPTTIGDLEEGTREAQLLLRSYWVCLRQLLRAAHWAFARKTSPLVLLADATGNTPNVGTIVPVPWIYSYSRPTDCMKARFVPWNYNVNPGAPQGNIVPANNQAPLTTAGQAPLTGARLRPARWVEATDFNYPFPSAPGADTWDTQGISPQGQTVILTNVKFAQLVYTALLNYPTNWDFLFRGAFVAYLASEVALPLWVTKDKKFGLEIRTQQIQIAKEKIQQARTTDGNEGFYSSDISVDWLRSRNSGGGRGNWNEADGGGPGILWGGYDSCVFSDGTAY
jgi:hypothetical protein